MIAKELIQFDIVAESQSQVLSVLLQTAFSNGRIDDVEAVLSAVLAREAEGTTGFGNGIAIPHGKSTQVKEPTLMYGSLRHGVEWKAMDGAPVQKIFLILVPESSHQEHLQMLAKLARKLMHDEFVKALDAISDASAMAEFLLSELE